MLMIDRFAMLDSGPDLIKDDDCLETAARESGCWGYDVRQLDAITRHPLFFMGYTALSRLGCIRHLNLNDRKLRNFLAAAERSMPDCNFYHNKSHVTGVVQCMYAQLRSCPLDDSLSACACIIAAVIHDCKHPGMSADRFRQVAPEVLPTGTTLEQYHLESALGIMTQPSNDFLDSAEPGVRSQLYGLVSELVLATDMAKHAELMKGIARSFLEDEGEERLLWLLRLFMKVADLHHCTGSPAAHVSWAKNLYSEAQGRFTDELPSAFGTGQLGFFDDVVLPMVDMMVAVRPATEPVRQLVQANRDCWL